MVPISRPDSSDFAGSHGSLIDYAVASYNTLDKSYLDSMFMFGDHKWLVCDVRATAKTIQRGKTHWVCTSFVDALAGTPDIFSFEEAVSMSFECLFEKVRDLQEEFADLRTCTQRSRDRLPTSIRELFERAN